MYGGAGGLQLKSGAGRRTQLDDYAVHIDAHANMRMKFLWISTGYRRIQRLQPIAKGLRSRQKGDGVVDYVVIEKMRLGFAGPQFQVTALQTLTE